MPVFDDHDKRIITETLTGVNTYTGSIGNKSGIPDDESDVGAWEEYGNDTRPSDFDSDHDGLPDWWENLFNLNVNSTAGDFSETNADVDGNGITWMDRYLDWMATPHYDLEFTGNVVVNLNELSRGFEKSPTYTIIDRQNCTVNIADGIASVNTTATNPGLGYFTFKVTDADGHSLTRKVGIRLVGSVTGITRLQKENEHISCVNPVENTLRLRITNNHHPTSIRLELSDIQGHNLSSNEYPEGTNEIVKDVSNYSNGIYILKISMGNQSQITKIFKK